MISFRNASKTSPRNNSFLHRSLFFEPLENRVLLNGDDLGLTGDWATFGGGPSHTGYFPGRFGSHPRYSQRWVVQAESKFNQVAVADGRVYATPDAYFGSTFAAALDAQTGVELWRHTFGTAHSINPPTFDQGHVYVQRGNHGSDSQIWSFNSSNGMAEWSTPFSNQWDEYYAPTVADGSIWVNAGYYGGMYGFDQQTGATDFFIDLPQYDRWTPTYHAGRLYSWVAGVFREHSPATGDILWSIDLGWEWFGSSMNTVAAISDERAFLVGSPGLHAVDLKTRTSLWHIDAPFTGSPAVAGDRVYALQQGQVKVHDAATGLPRGALDAGEPLFGQPIVTNDAVIAASANKTFVFDLATQALLMTIPVGGSVSLANDSLYIAGSTGGIHAFDLLTLPSLDLQLPVEVTESAGVVVGLGRVLLERPAATDLIVTLASNDPDRVSVPSTVMILSGSTSAAFDLHLVDNSLLDLNQSVAVTATTAGYNDASDSMVVIDDETTMLTVQVPANAVEGTGNLRLAGVVTAAQAPTRDVSIKLMSSDLTELVVPPEVTLSANSLSVPFDITIVDDAEVDGPQAAVLTATQGNWTQGNATIEIRDNETPFLKMTVPEEAVEGNSAARGTIHIPYKLTDDLVVQLSSDDESELVLPTHVVIPAGDLSAIFFVTGVDDSILDGTSAATLHASAAGFTDSSRSMLVHDNETAVLSVDVPDQLVEGDGTVLRKGLVSVSQVVEANVLIELFSSHANRIEVPARVVIPAGTQAVDFDLSVLDNRRVDGWASVTVTASVMNWMSGSDAIALANDDSLGLGGDWLTFGNGPGHNGYFPGHLGIQPTSSLKWSKSGITNPVVVGGGRIYATGNDPGNPILAAFEEQSGVEIWRYEFADAFSINPPTLHEGHVYVQRGNHAGDSQLWSFDTATGTADWSAPFSAQWEHYFAPTAADGSVWTSGGYFGGMYGFDQDTGAAHFYVPLGQYDQWTPSYSEGRLYSWVAGVFAEHSPRDGSILWSLNFNWNWQGWSMSTVSAIAGKRAYLVGSPNLYAVDLESRQVLWQVNGEFSGSPAIAHDTVYVLHEEQVKAFDALTGTPRGVFDAAEKLIGQPIVTDDAVIVASLKNTIAFDRETGERVLTLGAGGALSLAGNTLYVTGDNSLSAFELGASRRWQNPILKQDVNNDGVVTPNDLLWIINYLNAHGSGELWPRSSTSPYLDVSGDDVVTPMDVLLGINWLNENSRGEGEALQDFLSDQIDISAMVPISNSITGTSGGLGIRFPDRRDNPQNGSELLRYACLPLLAPLPIPCVSDPIASDANSIDLLLGEDLTGEFDLGPCRDRLELPEEFD